MVRDRRKQQRGRAVREPLQRSIEARRILIKQRTHIDERHRVWHPRVEPGEAQASAVAIVGVRGVRAPECLARARMVARSLAQIAKRKPCGCKVRRLFDGLLQHIDRAVPIPARSKLDCKAITPVDQKIAGGLEQLAAAGFHDRRYDLS